MDISNNEVTKIKNRIAKDTIIYLLGKGIEGIVGILTISLYTRFFLPQVYNSYSILMTSINVATVIFMSMLTQSGVRYINAYNSPRKKVLFFSTSFRLWAVINLIVFSLCFICFLLIKISRSNSSVNMQYYIIAAAFMFTGFSTSQVLSGFLTATRAIKLNMILSIFSVSAKLLLSTIGVKLIALGTSSPISVILANILVDYIVIVVIFIRLKLYTTIKLKVFSRNIFKKLFSFGIPMAGMGFAMSLLSLSDRYVINISLGSVIGPVKNGIYAANYSMASAVFSVLMIGMMRGVYPNILKAWKQNDREMSMSLLTQGIRNYILIALPCVVGLSALSGMVSGFFLDKEYHSGSSVIIWVSIGMFFLGLTEYSNKPWELTSKTSPTFINSLICGVFNISMNFIFIPIYGYMTAAITTALSYLLYFLISIIGSRRVLNFSMPTRSIIKIASSCMVMGLAVVLLKHLLTLWQVNKILILVSSVSIGTGIYGLILYFTGEIKYEVNQIRKRLNLV